MELGNIMNEKMDLVQNDYLSFAQGHFLFYIKPEIKPYITGIARAGRIFAIFESTNFSWERPITIIVSPPVPEILFITSSPKSGLKNPASKTKRAWKIKIEKEEKETPIPILWAIKMPQLHQLRPCPLKLGHLL